MAGRGNDGVSKVILMVQAVAIVWASVVVVIVPSQQIIDPWILSFFLTYGVPLVLFFGATSFSALRNSRRSA
jgi:hypothetical protein